MEDRGWLSILAVRARGVFVGQIAVVDRSNGSAFDLFDVRTVANPLRTQRRETFFHVDLLVGVAPGAAGVVNADRLVRFYLAGHGFGRGERDFAERYAEIGMEVAGDVDLFAVGQRSVGGLEFDGVFRCDHSVTEEKVRGPSTSLRMTLGKK